MTVVAHGAPPQVLGGKEQQKQRDCGVNAAEDPPPGTPEHAEPDRQAAAEDQCG